MTTPDVPVEIERKWAPDLPVNRPERAVLLEQGYLAHGEDAEVRVRRCGDQAWLTVKRGEGLVRIEVEVVISGAAFEELWAATAGAQLAKHRQEFLVDGREASLDTYTGALEGLQVVEVEFPDESTARAFTAPTWFGTEVTGRRDYTNSALARARRCPEAQ